MDVSLFDFPLPPELIAQKPSQKRQESRLLVVSKEREEFVQARFCDLPRFLSPGDLLVVNNTRVEPVKLIGKRENGVSVEFLLVQPLGDGLFSTLCKGPRRFREGEEISWNGIASAPWMVCGVGGARRACGPRASPPRKPEIYWSDQNQGCGT